MFGVIGAVAWRSLHALDVGQEGAGRVRELLRGVPFLTPLPLPLLERLVRNSEPVAVPAGTTVVSLGEPGHHFFVIEEGEADVLEYDRTVGAGDGFGEIALLRNVPRTATIRARTELRMHALNRPDFLAAVGGVEEVSTAADAAIAEVLKRPMRNPPP